MKRKVLRSAAVLGTVGLASVLLVACGSKKEASNNKNLTVYVEQQYKGYMEEAAKAYEKESGQKVDIKIGDALQGLDKLSTDNQAGRSADVMMAPYDRVGSLGSEGQLAEVKVADSAKADDTTKALVTTGDATYGAPAVIETLVMYYNKDLVSEAPKSFADLEELAKDSKYAYESESGKNTAFLADWTNFYYTYGLLSGNGGYVFGKNGTNPKDIGLANEGSVKGLEYAKTWFNQWPQGMADAEGAGNFIQTQFTTGKTAAIIDGPWKASALKEAKVNYGVVTIPTLADGKEYSAFGGGKAWVIPAGSKKVAEAQKFVDFLTSTDQQKAFYDATNEVPANTEAREYAVSKNDELTAAVVKQFASAQPMPNISEMGTVWDPAKSMLIEVATGKKDAKTAASDAVKAIEEQIAQKFGN